MKMMKLLLAGLSPVLWTANAWSVNISDVTETWRFRENLISAFPKIYETIPKEENANIIRIFHYFQGDLSNPLNERRVEVFYTGGDWMEFGLTYFVANSPNIPNGIYQDSSAAYFISELSTTDREEGAIAPIIDPLDPNAVKCFIQDHFLNEVGDVQAGYKPLSRP